MNNNIKKYLKEARNKGKTITEIINNSGIGRTSFYEIMSGRQIPKLDTAMGIAKAFGKSVSDIFPDLEKGEY